MAELWKRFFGWCRGDPYLNATELRVVRYIGEHPQIPFPELAEGTELKEDELAPIIRRFKRLGFLEIAGPEKSGECGGDTT